MRRKTAALLLALSLGGCMSVETGPDGGPGPAPPSPGYGGGYHGGSGMAPPAVPGVQGAWGQNVPMIAPYSYAPPGAMAAQAMLSNSIPLNMVQMAGAAPQMPGPAGANPPNLVMPAGGMLTPPGIPFAPGMPSGLVQANVPPGAAGPGGILQASYPPPGAVAAFGALTNLPRFPVQRTQVQFRKPSGMKVSWQVQGPDGKPGFAENSIQTPGRYNFLQGAIYRLKLSNIKDRPLMEIYPTLEVVPTNSKTEAFLAHSAVPVEFTDEDFKQIADGNYVVKVIYLPDPQYQELAGTGTEEILSTRLEPGADPIQEALRRGSILLVLRMGNIFQELANTPPMNAPGQGAPAGKDHLMPPPGFPGTMVPYFGMRPQPTTPSGPIQIMPPPGSMGPAVPSYPPSGSMAGPGPFPGLPGALPPTVPPNRPMPPGPPVMLPPPGPGAGPFGPPPGPAPGPRGPLPYPPMPGPGFGPVPSFPVNNPAPGMSGPGIRTIPPPLPGMNGPGFPGSAAPTLPSYPVPRPGAVPGPIGPTPRLPDMVPNLPPPGP